MGEIFKKVILLGRPGSGKSEIIDCLKKTAVETRIRQYHIGVIEEIDDFPMLWTWFEEDEILEKKFGMPRLHSDSERYFLDNKLWSVLIERISLEYTKKLKDNPDYHNNTTTLIEFSRGTEHGGYREAFKHLSKEILEDAIILYVNVPYEESLRKNRKRYNPNKPHSILEHGMPDSQLERLYKEVDWEEVTKDSPTHININGIEVPYIVFENLPSKTDDYKILTPELERLFRKLWEMKNSFVKQTALA